MLARRITLLEIVTAVEGKPTATKLVAISPAQRAAMRTGPQKGTCYFFADSAKRHRAPTGKS
ncbi:MAG: hypothetical protein K2Y37_23740 [Pirellulales bacterium]|nr:hypothetical protein [Pirellulales bacterium]